MESLLLEIKMDDIYEDKSHKNLYDISDYLKELPFHSNDNI